MSAIGLRRLGFIVAAFVLQTALLRAALPGPNEARARPSLAGQLLVAAPGMGDPRFERTVILIDQRESHAQRFPQAKGKNDELA